MPNADRLIEVFTAAKALPAGAERDQLLAEACHDNLELKEQVLSLLRANESAGDFLQCTPFTAASTERPGDRIGRYKLLQQIGEGGCGVVYMAEQEEPVRRLVALKVIRLGMDTKQVVARFNAERQALALMDHPNIAKVLDAGATEAGRPYFVMELVRGAKITDHCDETNASTEERLKLFIQVCQAIQHAHQKGVIHRDIKPSNILVTVNEGIPVPKVIDFGIAKATQGRLTDQTFFTVFDQFIGTPAYMSPEQAVMTSLDIDTRSDIYSLGVLLYELLTGRTPFDSKQLLAIGLEEMRRTIRDQEPLRPSACLGTMAAGDLTTTAARRQTDARKLFAVVSGDLDWVTMKCLEKDRGRRYETASGLAKELKRYLDNEPVTARPPTFAYRLGKFAQRHRRATAVVAGFALTLILTAVVSTAMALYANRQKVRAFNAESWTRDNLYAADMGLAQLAVQNGHFTHARNLLRNYLPTPGETDHRGLEWRYLWKRCKGEQLAKIPLSGTEGVSGLAITPDDRFLIVTRSRLDRIEVIRFEDFKSVFTTRAFEKGIGGCSAATISLDGKMLAVSGNADDEVSVWKIGAQGTLTLQRMIRVPKPFGVAFTPDAAALAVGTEPSLRAENSPGGTTRLFDLESGGEIASFPGSGGRAVALSSDGKWLATGPSKDQDLKLWDTAERKIVRTLKFPVPLWAEFSSDSQFLFSGTWYGDATLLSLSGARSVAALPHRGNPVVQGTRSADGKWAATCTFSEITLEDLQAHSSVGLSGHGADVLALAFSHDSKFLVSGDADGKLLLWSASGKRKGRASVNEYWATSRSLPMPPSSPNGEKLALRIEDTFGDLRYADHAPGHIKILNGKAGGVGPVLPSASYPLAFLDDDTLLTIRNLDALEFLNRIRIESAIVNHPPELEIWNLTTLDKKIVKLEMVGKNNVSAVDVSPDRRLVALAWWQDEEKAGGVRVVDSSTGELRFSASAFEQKINGLAFSPDGRALAVAMQSGTVQILQPPSAEAILTLKSDGDDVAECLTFSPDGRRLAVGGWRSLRVWSLPDGKEEPSLGETSRAVRHVRFSADGKTLIADGDAKTMLWDLRTKRELLEMPFNASRGLLPLTGERYASLSLIQWPIHRFIFEIFELPPLQGAERWLDSQPATLTEARPVDPKRIVARRVPIFHSVERPPLCDFLRSPRCTVQTAGGLQAPEGATKTG